jgi:hypothetical protein
MADNDVNQARLEKDLSDFSKDYIYGMTDEINDFTIKNAEKIRDLSVTNNTSGLKELIEKELIDNLNLNGLDR